MDPVSANGVGGAEFPPVERDEAERLLRDSRDRVVAKVGPLLGSILDAIEAELRARVDMAASAEERKRLQQALSATTSGRRVVESSFRSMFLELFDRCLSGENQEAKGAISLDQLSLVDDQEMDEDLAVKRLETYLRESCGDEVSNMERRLTAVLARRDINDSINPFSPRVFMESLRAGCRAVVPDGQIRAELLRAVNKEACQHFQSVLAAANAPLALRVGLPDRRTRIRPERDADAKSAGGPGAASAQSGGGSGGATGGSFTQPAGPFDPTASWAGGGAWAESGESAGFAPGDFMARLNQMLSARGPLAAGEGASGAGFPDVSSPSYGGGGSGGPGPVPPQLMGMLSALQHGAVPEAVRRSQAGAMLSPEHLMLGTENVLQALRTSGALAPANSMESLTIDVIAMMFDYIFDDASIAPEMKGVIGRLQIPLLKVALLDRQFFATRRHPARRLVDRMAELSNNSDPASEPGKILFNRLVDIVSRIQHGFEENAAIFDESLRQLEDCARSIEAMEQESLEVYTEDIRSAEEHDQQLVPIRTRLQTRIADAGLPAALRAFVLGPWCSYLLYIQQSAGEDSISWQTALQTLDDLIWSIRPKRHAGERDLLVRRLLTLTGSVKESLRIARASPQEQEALMDTLMKLHLAAMRPAPEGAPAPVADATADDEEKAEHFAEKPALPAAVRQGCWIEFAQESEKVKVRLSWISPMRSKFVFTRKGQHAFILSESELAEALTTGRASFVSEGASLMDRAAEKAFDALEAEAPATA